LNQKLRVAVLGVGHLGQHHARILHQMDKAELVAVVDTDQERGSEIAQLYGVPALSHFSQLPDDLDAVSLVTPTETHLELGLAALDKGWHLFIEKPITKSVDEARKLVGRVEQTDLKVQIGHIERFNSAVIELQRFLKNPLFIESHRLGPPVPRVKDIGVVKDWMIHDLDLVLSLVGSKVETVDSVGIPVLTEHEDIANARIRFENGCVANLTTSRVTPEQMRKIRFFQSDAYLSLDFSQQQLQVYRKVEPAGGGKPFIDRTMYEMKSEEDALTRELGSFVDSILENRVPVVTAGDGMRALELAEEISGQIISISNKIKSST
jgi:predicted dehydrogenase